MSAVQVGLTSEEVKQYSTEGFLVLRSVFNTEELGMLATEAKSLTMRSELIDTQNIRCRWSDDCNTGECAFDCFDPVIDIGPVCRYFAYDDRILSVLRTLYGDEAYLFKDKLIFKKPGSKGYDLHQDFISWPGFPESFITVIVAIDATNRENGATEVFPRYHQQGYMSPRDGEYHQLSADSVDETRGVILELEPGDIAVFGGFVPHCSGPNRSSQWRRQLYLSYNAGRDGGEQRDNHYRKFHEWLIEKYAQYGKTGVYFR